jgi:hypothetical protein
MIRLFGPVVEEVTEVGENCIMRNFITYTRDQISLYDKINVDETAKSCSTHEEITNPYK